MITDLKTHVSGVVRFEYYVDGNLWYSTEAGLKFPVPIEDTKGAVFLPEDKGLFFMRWIRKHLAVLQEANQ